MRKIHLQGMGMVDAIPAKDIKLGDVLVWNYGQTSFVRQILKETKTQIVIQTLCGDGNLYKRRLSKNSLVGIQTSK